MLSHRAQGFALLITVTALGPAATAAPGQAPGDWRASFQAYQSAQTTSRSVGAPNGGRLVRGHRLPRAGPGFVRRARGNQFGTAETIALIRFAGARLAEAYPGTTPLLVGDISRERGGRLRPHRSHQSGRDVDIAFPERADEQKRTFNPRLRPDGVDIEKTWFV
ncbi:MAG: penicillin-insensitive murein endopeptidase, partial [Myxococcota bacterium]|nr:penicillin-insensitive murein endopeptidase [Myxococcota bacterium]